MKPSDYDGRGCNPPYPTNDTESRRNLDKLVDWLYGDDDQLTIEEVEAELKAAGVDMDAAMVKLGELLSRYRRSA